MKSSSSKQRRSYSRNRNSNKLHTSWMRSRTQRSSWKILRRRWLASRRNMIRSRTGSTSPICTNSATQIREPSKTWRRTTSCSRLHNRRRSIDWPRSRICMAPTSSEMQLHILSSLVWITRWRCCGIRPTTCKKSYTRSNRLRKNRNENSRSCERRWSRPMSMSKR